MSDKAVISGTYSDFKVLKTRGVVSIGIEVPLERAQSVIEAFGVPNPSEEITVAVARLGNVSPPYVMVPEELAEAAIAAEDMKPGEISWVKPSSDKPKSYAQEAAILGQDPLFHSFLVESEGISMIHTLPDKGSPEDWAKLYIYEKCDVNSRRDLIEGTPEGMAFREIVSAFKAWKLDTDQSVMP